MGQLPITNVISISVATPQMGLGEYNVNNAAIFTTDVPADSFGSLGYALYLSPGPVSTDFGTASNTSKMATSLFSQQPNILAGGGYLAVIQMLPQTVTMNFSPNLSLQSGSAVLHSASPSMNYTMQYSDTAADLETGIQGIVASGITVKVTQATPAAGEASPFVIKFYAAPGLSAAALTISSQALLHGSTTVTASLATVAAETYPDALVRTMGLVQYFGAIPNQIQNSSNTLAAAAVLQAVNKMGFFVQSSETTIEPGGLLDLLTTGGFTHSRGIYYGQAAADIDALEAASSYMGRALSTNFDGSLTTQTMHLKSLATIQPDLSLTQTTLTEAILAGADTYPSLQGVPSVFTSGANQFFDDQYNLQWLVGALEVAGFNFLAQSLTKISQTEQGINGLKGAYRAVLQQAVGNGYLAPGTWTSSTTFGNQADFLSNIATYGYYIYSTPVSQQSAVARADREAPLIQIAIKLAGAVQSSSVIVYVNA